MHKKEEKYQVLLVVAASYMQRLQTERIVDKINNSIGQDPDATNIIGVLDIYGFESFKINRFAVSLVLSGSTASMNLDCFLASY